MKFNIKNLLKDMGKETRIVSAMTITGVVAFLLLMKSFNGTIQKNTSKIIKIDIDGNSISGSNFQEKEGAHDTTNESPLFTFFDNFLDDDSEKPKDVSTNNRTPASVTQQGSPLNKGSLEQAQNIKKNKFPQQNQTPQFPLQETTAEPINNPEKNNKEIVDTETANKLNDPPDFLADTGATSPIDNYSSGTTDDQNHLLNYSTGLENEGPTKSSAINDSFSNGALTSFFNTPTTSELINPQNDSSNDNSAPSTENNQQANTQTDNSSIILPVITFSKNSGTYSRKFSVDISSDLSNPIYYCLRDNGECCSYQDEPNSFSLYSSSILIGPIESHYCISVYSKSLNGISGTSAAQKYVLSYSAPNLEIQQNRSHYQTTNLYNLAPHKFTSLDVGNSDFLFSILRFPSSPAALSCQEAYQQNQTNGPYGISGLINLPMDDLSNTQWLAPYQKDDFIYGSNFLLAWIYNPYYTSIDDSISCVKHTIVLEDFSFLQNAPLHTTTPTDNVFSLNTYQPLLDSDFQSYPAFLYQ